MSDIASGGGFVIAGSILPRLAIHARRKSSRPHLGMRAPALDPSHDSGGLALR